MRRRALASALGFAALLAAGCGRDFEPPPPAVSVDALEPPRGFAGDLLVLCGQNLEATPALNLVYFDTELAEVLAAPPEGLPAGCQAAVRVVVPELGEPGEKSVRVSTSSSQAAAAMPFVYLGAGHPPEERVGNAFRVRSAPASASLPVGPFVSPLLLLAGTESASLDFLALGADSHLRYSACLPPLSAAMLLGTSGAPGVQATLELYAVLFLGAQAGSLEEVTRLTRSSAQVTDGGAIHLTGEADPDVALPAPPAGVFFLPGLVFGACPEPSCAAPGLVVTNLAAPSVAYLSHGAEPSFSALLMDAGSTACAALGAVTDVAPREGAAAPGRLLASVEGTLDLWGLDLATGAATRVSRLEGAARCLAGLGPLASRRLAALDLEERVYAASGRSLWTFLGQPDGSLALPGEPADSVAYQAMGRVWDLATALHVDAGGGLHERLVVAAEDGLHLLDASAPGAGPLDLEAFLPWPVGYNTVQSLSVLRVVDPAAPVAGARDRIAYVDPVGDVLLELQAGAELDTLRAVGLGPTLPELAFARRSGQIFLSDPTANAIRPVEPRAGAQGDPIFPAEAGALVVRRLHTLELGGAELLLASLAADDQTGAGERELLGRIAVAQLTDRDGAALPLGCRQATGPLPCLDLEAAPGDLRFHDLFLFGGEEPEAALVRYGAYREVLGQLVPVPGWLRVMSVEPGRAGAPLALGEATSLEVVLPPEVVLLTASPRHGLVAALVRTAPEQGEPPGALLAVLDRAELAGAQLADLLEDARLALLPPATAMFAADLAVARVGPPEARRTLVALALGQLGEVLVVEPRADGAPRSVPVVTGGLPVTLAVSPDERRVYVTHPHLGQVQTLSLCPDPPACAADPRVTATLEVAAWPLRVFFAPSGAQAFVAHYQQGAITVIE